ncbi:5-(carboxyamino)imidazole ribonucleotide synthase [[Leptolyngbya] sp. PCC 7376]|uniref:5-(carboxyamino)imidazole ribonucleotide synthase n=1 Tax=[Leptolyngbya] sp. PCC 7376 TaxID=111781 RepID=UPI0005A17185|nr:5-(carboxyamino)imidazole ribonucleotide synthase [[Leptolyngbya] sp. PCC 7376]
MQEVQDSMKQRVGVIGGGQLAWMMGAEAKTLGLELWLQTPNASDPAVARADKTILADLQDITATAKLSEECAVVTFENEFVDLEALGKLAAQGANFRPSLAFLEPLLDKYDQRRCCEKFNILVPHYQAWSLTDGLPEGWQYPLVIKARRHGYDGKGTFVIKNEAELKALPTGLEQTPLLLEAFVPFEQELAVMVARSASGDIRVFPVVETQQIHQVCHWAIAPAAVNNTVEDKVIHIAQTLAENLGLVGIMGIELFLTPAGEVLVNEIAPRTHNSGHFSLDACQTSQFAMQLQAIAGLPLGSPDLLVKGAVMVNLLGFEHSDSDYDHKRQILTQMPDSHVHWYGKAGASPGRKLGHVTITSPTDDRSTLMAIAKKIERLWYAQSDE